MMIQTSLVNKKSRKVKSLAILIDPDNYQTERSLEEIANFCDLSKVDYIFIGGSLLVSGSLSDTVNSIKKFTTIPTVLFPGSNLHIDKQANAILFLSLISGRNPDLLIGQHVSAAPILKKSGIEVMSTGYILVGNDTNTTVAHISQTSPIPTQKADIAVCTAIAGEMLGMKLIYLDAGSGANEEVPEEMIKKVRNSIKVPLIVGGGINTTLKASIAYNAGADLIVLGSVVEKNVDFISEIASVRDNLNSKHS